MALPSTQQRDCSQGHREKGQRSYIHRTLRDSHPGLGRKLHSICRLPALDRPHPSNTHCVLITQSTFSTVPRPHQLPTLLSGSQDTDCFGGQRRCDICTQEAWGRVMKRVCWGCRGAARGQGEFQKSQVQTKKGPKFKKRKHQRLSLASRVLEQWRWVNPGPQGPPPRADAALRAPVSHSDRRPCSGAL